MKQRDGTTREKPLSRKTVRHAYSLLSAAFNYAAEMDDRASLRNPCNNENLRKRLTVPDSKAVALTNAETIALLDAARGTRWEAFIDLALSLAFRRGELCALSWSDYNEEQHTLTVRHSLSQTKRGIALKEPKTKQIRTLPLSRIAITALAKQRGLQAADADAPYYENTEGAIFTDEAGQRITPMAASCAFERLARKAKLSTTRLHDLRHTAATRLLLSGADVRTVAGILGHSSPVTTLRVYAHLLPEAQREGVERLGQHLENLGKTADLTTDGHVMATSKVTVLRKPA